MSAVAASVPTFSKLAFKIVEALQHVPRNHGNKKNGGVPKGNALRL